MVVLKVINSFERSAIRWFTSPMAEAEGGPKPGTQSLSSKWVTVEPSLLPSRELGSEARAG